MKLLLLALLVYCSSALAKEIQGVLVLKGTLKSKIMVNNDKTICKVKIEKVRNVMDEEDSFGNPAYKIRTQIELNGNEKVKYNKEVLFTNLFKNGDTSQAEDLKYFVKAEPLITMSVDSEGHAREVSFPFQNQTIKCRF